MRTRKERNGAIGYQVSSRLYRIVAWLLSFVIMVTELMSNGIRVYADTPVSEIHVTGVNLNRIVGEMPDTSWVVAETDVVENIEVVWKDANNDFAEITSEFEIGMAPSVYIYVTLKSGYSFADDFKLYINNGNYGKRFSGARQVWTNIPFNELTAQLSDTIEITDLDLNFEVGEVLDREITVNDEHAVVKISWTSEGYDGELKKARYLTSPILKIWVTGDEGYNLTSTPTLKINDESVEYSEDIEDGKRRLYYSKTFPKLNPPESAYIDDVYVTIPGMNSVAIGEVPDTSYTCTDPRFDISLSVIDWNNENAIISRYAVGQRPRYRIIVNADPNYVFKNTSRLYVNNKSWVIERKDSWSIRAEVGDWKTLYYDDISTVNISELEAPVNGALPGTVSTDNANIESVTVVWKDEYDNVDERFVGGNKYHAEITLTAKEGHGFDKDTTVHMLRNGIALKSWSGYSNQIELTENNTKLKIVTDDYDLKKDVVKKVEFTIAEPVIGETPDTGGTKAGYTWTLSFKDEEDNVPSVFEEGKKYKAHIVIEAEAGFIFDSGVYASGHNEKVLINGQPVTVNAGGMEGEIDTDIEFACTHKYGEGVITTAAGCETKGVKSYTCEHCNHIKTEEIPATGHDWGEWKKVKEPTATEEGIEERVCKNDPSHKEQNNIAKLPFVNLTSISLSENVTIGIGETLKLDVNYTPEDATDKTVEWKSSDNDVATVDATGNIKGIKSGDAIITATAKDGGHTASCNVKVAPAQPDDTTLISVKLTSVSLSENVAIRIGETLTLSVNYTPEDATDKTVEWKSSDTDVAIVDAVGNIKGIRTGYAIITATAKDGGHTSSCKVKVTPAHADDTADTTWISEEDLNNYKIPEQQKMQYTAEGIKIRSKNESKEVKVSISMNYLDAVTYNGKVLTPKTSAEFKFELKLDDLLTQAGINGVNADDIFKVSFVGKSKDAGNGTFYAKVSLVPSARKKFNLTKPQEKDLRKIISAVNKQLKADEHRVKFKINKASITDLTDLKVSAKLTKDGKLKIDKKDRLTGIKSVKYKKAVADTKYTTLSKKAGYSVEAVDINTLKVKISGTKNYTGWTTVMVTQ